MRATSLKTKPFKRTQKTNPDTTVEPSADRHKPAKITRNRIPPPERELILQMSASGKSIQEISTKLERNRETVSRVIRGPEMQKFVLEMRERFFALAPHAVDAVEHSLRKKKDGRLALQFLSSIGVPLSEHERTTLMAGQEIPNNDDGARKIMADLIAAAIERAMIFGYRDSELDRDLKAVNGQINYTTGQIEPLTESSKT
jgi:hypothetical protein